MKRMIVILPLFVLLLGRAERGLANLITNGSFESPVLAPGQAFDVPGGSTAITGWTALGNDVNLLQTTYSEPANGLLFEAQDGLNSIDITGAGNTGPTDGLQQGVATTPGQQYLLSFYVGRGQSSNGAPGYQTPATVDLSINGGSRVSFTNANPAPPGLIGWEQFSTSFFAAGPTTTIAFLNGTPFGSAEGGLDNVVLTAVPEPSTLSFLAIGVGLFAIRLRTRR